MATGHRGAFHAESVRILRCKGGTDWDIRPVLTVAEAANPRIGAGGVRMVRGGYDEAFPMIEAPPMGARAGNGAEIQRVRRRLIALGIGLTMAILAAAGLVSAIQRANVFAEARTAVENIALVLAEQTSRSIQPVDLTLREFEARLSTAAPNEWSSEVLYRLLAERAKTLSQVYALMLIGADGHVVNVSMEYPAVRVDASARDHFKYLGTHDDHALFISAPAKTQHTGQWSVFLSRRINDRDGGFAGVVVATVTLSYLGDFYRAVTPANGSVTLLRRDGTILVRNPPLEQEIGIRLPAGSPWYGIAAGAGGWYPLARLFQYATETRLGAAIARLSTGGRRHDDGRGCAGGLAAADRLAAGGCAGGVGVCGAAAVAVRPAIPEAGDEECAVGDRAAAVRRGAGEHVAGADAVRWAGYITGVQSPVC